MKEHNFAQPGREFYRTDGQPEDPARVKRYEKFALENEQQSPELMELLSGFDFDSIRDMYVDSARHTDVDPPQMNFIGPDRIVEADMAPGELAEYVSDGNLMKVNLKFILQISQEMNIDPKILLLDALIHEEGHVTAKSKHVGLFEQSNLHRGHMRSGYLQQFGLHEADPRKNMAFVMFEEGVTEKNSRLLSERYLAAHPDFGTPGERESLRNHHKDDSKAKGYDMAVSFVESFTAHLAHEAGVSEELVWNSILRGKMEGTDLGDSDFATLFAEIFNHDFQNQLAGVNAAEDELNLVPLMNMEKLKTINPGLWSRINRRINALKAYERKTKAA